MIRNGSFTDLKIPQVYFITRMIGGAVAIEAGCLHQGGVKRHLSACIGADQPSIASIASIATGPTDRH